MANDEKTPRNDEGDSESVGFKVFDRRHWALDEDQLDNEQAHESKPSYIEQLEAQVAQKDAQLREYIAAYKKEVVEGLEETKRRLTRDAEQQLKRARAEMALPMLEVFEALERSVFAAQAAKAIDAVVEGVQMVKQLMQQKLGEIGLARVETVGQPFDPNVHEAVALAPVSDASQNNVVLAELSPGFVHEGRVFRPAKVQVGKLQA